jgi:hypothetical protein
LPDLPLANAALGRNPKDSCPGEALRNTTKKNHNNRRVCLLLLGFASLAALSARADEQNLNAIVQQFRNRLHISQPVTLSTVDVNKYLVSTEPPSKSVRSFIIKFDKNFLPTLTDDELRAVIAHELGHIWILNHAPYIQTEPLANEEAMQLVSRESLESVYEKVWEAGGRKGTLESFLGKILVQLPPQPDEE